jgi:hypothetical protein
MMNTHRSSSKTVLVIRDTESQRAFLNPIPIKSCRVNGTVFGARDANGESGSPAQPQMSAKKVLTVITHACAVCVLPFRFSVSATKARAWAGSTWLQLMISGYRTSMKRQNWPNASTLLRLVQYVSLTRHA